MNILAIGPHPDDIEFGCGGALIKYAQNSHKVYLLVLTKGSFGGDPKEREREQQAAADFLRAAGLFWGEFQDTELIYNRELILKIEEVIQRVGPEIVFLNYIDDIHQDILSYRCWRIAYSLLGADLLCLVRYYM